MKSFAFISLSLLVLNITASPFFKNNAISVEEAAKRGLIKLFIKSKGGYTGNVIEMKIKNNTTKNIELKLEAGRKLDSKNNNEQDILVTQAQELIIYANQQKKLDVMGMCCQAGNSCPRVNSDYTVGTMADSNLIKIAQFIDKNKYYDNYTAQQAVWCVSDNKSLASIYGGDEKIVKAIRNYVSLVTGKPIPSYNITYKEGNNNSVIGHPFKIEGVFDYTLNTTGHVTLAIYDVSGKMVQLIFKNIAHDRGEHKIYYTFRTKDLPEGTYYARMTNEGRTEKEMKIEF